MVGAGVLLIVSRPKKAANARAATIGRQARRRRPSTRPRAKLTGGATANTVTSTTSESSGTETTTTNSATATTPDGPLTTTSTPRTSSGSSRTSHGGGVAGETATAALDRYWTHLGGGEYVQAYDAESASEQHTDSLSDMRKEQPQVNLMWIKDGVPNADGEAVRVNFYTVDNDGVCRHFSIDSQMVRAGSGWLYDGPVAGAALVDSAAQGDPNCPG